MFVSTYGNFNGSTWEAMCQIIFKRKYMHVSYQTVKASPGDFGIEGFTKDGQAFQCYCPEVNLDNKKLYEQQRDKITADINKLNTNKKELLEILDGIKIKKWILVTPRFSHHDLTIHCNAKKNLVKSWGLPFIDSDFEVLVQEADDYAFEIGEYFNTTNKKFSINPQQGISTTEKIIEWKTSEIDLVQNAIKKNNVRIQSTNIQVNFDYKVNELTDKNARDYLNGESMLRTWQSSQPENHQRFIELLASVEEELVEKCIINEVDPNTFVGEILNYMDGRIRTAFPFLDESTMVRLKNYSVSSWILRCPLYFQLKSDEN
jgi:hypothetical protein